MGETTLKTFALHYQILWVEVANLVKTQIKNVYSLSCHHVWNFTDNWFCINFSDVRRGKRINQKSNKDIKTQIWFEQLLNYFWLKLFKLSKSNQGFGDLSKMEQVYKPSHHLVLHNTFQFPNFVQWFSLQSSLLVKEALQIEFSS